MTLPYLNAPPWNTDRFGRPELRADAYRAPLATVLEPGPDVLRCSVCPCDCFRDGEQMLYIDREECIDCDACVPECPVEAIFYEENVPEDQKEFIALSAEMSQEHQDVGEGTPGIGP